MNILTYWTESRSGIPEANTLGDVEAHLQTAAAEIARCLKASPGPGERSKYRHDQWAIIGVDPVQANISSDGAAFTKDGRLRVIVKADQPVLRQRYTVAHEIGHHLLRQVVVHNHALKLPAKVEETLCDAFASLVLVPDAALDVLMGPLRAAPRSKDVLDWCQMLQVNIAPMLIAVKRRWRWGASVLMYCQHYAHRRDAEPALRSRSYAAAEPLYIPTHKRIVSLDLVDIEDWFKRTSQPYGSGTTPKVRLQLYARDMDTRSGFVEGCVDWSAMRLNDSTQGSGRLFVDLKLTGDWNIKWTGGKFEPLDLARLGKVAERKRLT